jgi:hypothetical protein
MLPAYGLGDKKAGGFAIITCPIVLYIYKLGATKI